MLAFGQSRVVLQQPILERCIPPEMVICLEPLDWDNLIPFYGFFKIGLLMMARLSFASGHMESWIEFDPGVFY